MSTPWKPGRGSALFLQDMAERDARVARAWAEANRTDDVWKRCAIFHQQQAAETAELARWAAGVEE